MKYIHALSRTWEQLHGSIHDFKIDARVLRRSFRWKIIVMKTVIKTSAFLLFPLLHQTHCRIWLATFIVWSVTPGPRIKWYRGQVVPGSSGTGVKWYRGQEKFLTSRHVRMHRVVFYISNTLRKVMIRALVWCLGKCFWLGFGLEKEKQLTSKTRSNIFQRFYLFPYCSLLWVSDI